MASRQLVRVVGVCVWALLMVLELVTHNTAFLYAAIVVIVLFPIYWMFMTAIMPTPADGMLAVWA